MGFLARAELGSFSVEDERAESQVWGVQEFGGPSAHLTQADSSTGKRGSARNQAHLETQVSRGQKPPLHSSEARQPSSYPPESEEYRQPRVTYLYLASRPTNCTMQRIEMTEER